jgi:HlyD family secretion protein
MTRRKKIIISIVVAVLILWLYGAYQKSKNKQWSWEVGKTTKIVRDDLVIPVQGNGSVEPAQSIDVKSKASGRVVKVNYQPADKVHKGDLLVELDPIDEQRNVGNAQSDVYRAQANLNQAQLQAERVALDWPVQMTVALANLDVSRADLHSAAINFKSMDQPIRGQNAAEATGTLIDEDKIKPTDLDLHDSPLLEKHDALVQECAQALAVAEAESLQAKKLIEGGKNRLANYEKAETVVFPRTEYEQAISTLQRARAVVRSRCAEVRTTINQYIAVEQAGEDITLADQALKQAKLALEQFQEREKETKVYAPFDGLVEKVYIHEGEVIQSGITTVTGGTPLMKVVDVSDLYVVAEVDEADIGRVRDLAPREHSGLLDEMLRTRSTQPGTLPAPPEKLSQDINQLKQASNVNITVDAFREEVFTGVVDLVDPHPNEASNVVTYSVRILLTSDNRKELMLGMNANVEFTTQKRNNVLLVDNEAIHIINDEKGVYIPADPPPGDPVFVPLKLGETNGSVTEITSDQLKEGQDIYTKLPRKRSGEGPQQEEYDE